MSTVKVKICGLTRKKDVLAAVDAGADILGFVFAHSPRQLGIGAAGKLMDGLSGRIIRVGLFMNNSEARVAEVVECLPLDLLQFHGDETNGFCRSFGLPYIKAIPMGADISASDRTALYPDATGLLFDSHRPGGAGGTGSTFDWSLLDDSGHRLWLAGGLNPQNIAQAVAQVKPWAVDTSSGVEDSPGHKNHDLIRAFIAAAKSIDIGK